MVMGAGRARQAAADAAFDAFYRAEYPRLAGALRLACADPSVADELAQEAFVRLGALRALLHRAVTTLRADASLVTTEGNE